MRSCSVDRGCVPSVGLQQQSYARVCLKNMSWTSVTVLPHNVTTLIFGHSSVHPSGWLSDEVDFLIFGEPFCWK